MRGILAVDGIKFFGDSGSTAFSPQSIVGKNTPVVRIGAIFYAMHEVKCHEHAMYSDKVSSIHIPGADYQRGIFSAHREFAKDSVF